MDLVYKPISPCRFIDTRSVGGPINGTRSFNLNLTGATYGGQAACNPIALIGSDILIGGFAANLTTSSPRILLGSTLGSAGRATTVASRRT